MSILVVTPPTAERLLELTAYNLYLATVVGNPAPRVAALHRRITDPQPGDVVCEVSTIYDEKRTGTRLGVLQRIVMEPVYPPDVWRTIADQFTKMPVERVYYIERLNGDGEFRWVNAEFIVVPSDVFRMPDRLT